MSADTLIVSGASGQLGQRVLDHLLDGLHAAPSRIIALTRTPDRLASYAARGVSVRAADFDDEATLEAAFRGGARLLLISTGELAPGRRQQQHGRAIDAAVRAGVRHVVYTSVPRPAESTLTLARDHERTEALLGASGLSATFLRNNWYFENLLFLLPPHIAAGEWHSSAGTGRIAYVSRADCARVAAAVLASTAEETAAYDVTGEEALSAADVAALLASELGVTLDIVPESDGSLAVWLEQGGVPAGFAHFVAEIDASVRAGHLADVSDTVRRFTGRPAERLGDWLRGAGKALTTRA